MLCETVKNALNICFDTTMLIVNAYMDLFENKVLVDNYKRAGTNKTQTFHHRVLSIKTCNVETIREPTSFQRF